jgi:DNA-binding NarL/FixJ family response regulator
MAKEYKMTVEYDGNERDLSNVLKKGIAVTSIEALPDGSYKVVWEERNFVKPSLLTDEQREAIIQCHKEGLTYDQITEKLGIDRWRVYDTIKDTNCVRRKGQHVPQILKLAAQGMAPREIASELKISPTTVNSALKNPEKYDKSALTERNLKICKEYAEGKDAHVLAEEYGLSYVTIRLILRSSQNDD